MKNQTKPRSRTTPPMKVWPETYEKLSRVAKQNQWKLVVAIDNAANALIEREERRREKQSA